MSPAALRRHAEDLTEAARARLRQVQEVHTAMQAVTVTVTSARREVLVKAGFGGRIDSVSFPTSAYKRLPSAELAAIVLATVTEAQRGVEAAVAEILQPTLPEGIDAAALASGNVDLSKLSRFPDSPLSAPSDASPVRLARPEDLL